MRNYYYQEKWERLFTPQVVVYLTIVHEYKGGQRLISSRYADALANLGDVAKIHSTESSNKIQDIYTSDNRLKKIVLDKTIMRTFLLEVHLFYSFIEFYISLRTQELMEFLKFS